MAGPMMAQDPMDNVNELIESKKQAEKQMLEKDFNKIQNQITNNPEKINKISKEELETVKKFVETNEEEAFDTYIKVFETLQNPDDLGRRDKKSLNEIKDAIASKYKEEEIGEYQMNKEVFGKRFDFDELKKLGKNFQKGTTTNWFKKIPENYEGGNEEINSMCEGKLYTSEQLVKGLYDKNEARRNEISKIISEMDISKLDGIESNKPFDAGSDNAKIIVNAIKSKGGKLAHDFWEYGDFEESISELEEKIVHNSFTDLNKIFEKEENGESVKINNKLNEEYEGKNIKIDNQGTIVIGKVKKVEEGRLFIENSDDLRTIYYIIDGINDENNSIRLKVQDNKGNDLHIYVKKTGDDSFEGGIIKNLDTAEEIKTETTEKEEEVDGTEGEVEVEKETDGAEVEETKTPENVVKEKKHTVKSLDSLSKIAKENGVTLDKIKELNPNLFKNVSDRNGKNRSVDGGLIYPGDEIIISKAEEDNNSKGTVEKGNTSNTEQTTELTTEEKKQEIQDIIDEIANLDGDPMDNNYLENKKKLIGEFTNEIKDAKKYMNGKEVKIEKIEQSLRFSKNTQNAMIKGLEINEIKFNNEGEVKEIYFKEIR